MRWLCLILLVCSCGGSKNNTSSDVPEGISTEVNNGVFSMSVGFDSLEGNARWTLELVNNEVGLGVCEFEQKAKSDKTPMYFKNKGGDPICSGVDIDPISTINNLVINTNFDSVRYCVYDGEDKKCGELNK